jgi:hypothetical protein
VADQTDNYCGCCGWPCVGKWCLICRDHVAKDGRPDFDRTYFAQHGELCPNDVDRFGRFGKLRDKADVR